jgi:N-acetylglucosaminyl-diphospho-decaprenol L-rhamnosyltransferase
LATSDQATPEPEGAGSDATAVILIHNDGGLLGPLLDILLHEVRDVVVVDNASTDGSSAAVEGRDRVTLIRNERNAGFAAGVNLGAQRATGAWLLLVNPDVHLRQGQVGALLTGVPGDVAEVAPLQVDAEGRPRAETGGYEPTLWRYLVWALLPARYHGRFGPWLAPPFPASDTEVDWLSGALLGIRRDVFERLGGFDERFFMYHEDIDLARRARAAGCRVVCRPSVRLRHDVASGESARRIRSGKLSIESLAIDCPGLRRRILGAILGLGYGLRAVLASGTTRDLARAVLPYCAELMRGRVPPRA